MVKRHQDGYINIPFSGSPKKEEIILPTCPKRPGMYSFPSGRIFQQMTNTIAFIHSSKLIALGSTQCVLLRSSTLSLFCLSAEIK